MVILIRLISITSLVFTLVILIQPRSGWGRLLLFIPKLFAGSRIFFLGILGFVGAGLAWFFGKDILAISAGSIGVLIAARYIYRLIKSVRNATADLTSIKKKGMLPFSWVIRWKERGEVRWIKDLQIGYFYGSREPVYADLWIPLESRETTGTGIIYLHGSGWHYADKNFGTSHFFKHLSNQGHAILDVAYTLAPKADLFSMMGDVKQAVAWMKRQGKEYGVNPGRIVLMGGSAGGHLALLAAYTSNDQRYQPGLTLEDTTVQGIVSYYGPPDLFDQYDRFSELPNLRANSRFEGWFTHFLESRFGFKAIPVDRLLPNLLGGSPTEAEENYRKGSPITHVGAHCPPTLLLQGRHDFSGNREAVQRLYDALKKACVQSIHFELPDTEHGFDLYKPSWSPAAQAGTYVTERFLASLFPQNT